MKQPMSCSKRSVFIHNARTIYKQIPGSYGYDAFIYNYKSQYKRSGVTIGKNTFSNLFRKEADLNISESLAVKVIKLLNQFLYPEDQFTGDNDEEIIDDFTQTFFNENDCPAIVSDDPRINYGKYLQDYYVYFYRSDYPEVFSGILSVYMDNHTPRAWLLAYLSEEALLRDEKTWSIFNNMNQVEERYYNIFHKHNTPHVDNQQTLSPACRLYKSRLVTLSQDLISIELNGVCGHDGRGNIFINITNSWHTPAIYQGGLGVFLRWSTKSHSFHVSNIALVSCCNENAMFLKDDKGRRIATDVSTLYTPPLPLNTVGRELKLMTQPDVFSYFPRDDRLFYTWLKTHNTDQYRQASTQGQGPISVEQIDALIEMLQTLRSGME